MSRPNMIHPVEAWHFESLSGRSYGMIAAAYGVTRNVVAGALRRFRGPGGAEGVPRGRRPRRTATHFGCGHERTPENTHRSGPGQERCAICNRARQKHLPLTA